MLTTEPNAESECTAQGALLALFAPSNSPKSFYRSGARCSTAAKGRCADYNAAAGLSPPLAKCFPFDEAANQAIASVYAAGRIQGCCANLTCWLAGCQLHSGLHIPCIRSVQCTLVLASVRALHMLSADWYSAEALWSDVR